MPLALALAMLALRNRGGGAGGLGGLFGGGGGFGGRLRGFLGPRTTEPALAPEAYGGRTFTGANVGSRGGFEGMYGHGVGRGGVPTFSLPGAGGGDVMIPELARASAGGDLGARATIGRQGESAERFRDIDMLLELMREQARAAGMPDPFEQGAPTGGGGGTYP